MCLTFHPLIGFILNKIKQELVFSTTKNFTTKAYQIVIWDINFKRNKEQYATKYARKLSIKIFLFLTEH